MKLPKALQDLWNDKPLLIVTVVGLGVLLYVLYKSNSSNVVAPAASDATGAAAGTGGTFVEESYSLYAPTSNTTTSTAGTPLSVPTLASIIAPAGKGKLSGTTKASGKHDTNFQVYTVPAGATLASLAQHANWGSDSAKLANYRNNLQILQAAGVNTANPLASVPAGLKISI